MSTDLSPENEAFLLDQLSSGRFASREEALNAGLDLLKAREWLANRIQSSREQLDNGQYLELNEKEMSEYFAQLRKRATRDRVSIQ